MGNEGYIKLYRKMMEWGWYKDSNTKCVFIHLLFLAQFEPCFYRGSRLEVGQVVTTVREIHDSTGISVQSVRTSLKRLKSTEEITIETTPNFSIITLNNYADYQGDNKNFNKQLTNDQQTTNKQTEREKKEEKERSKEKEEIKEKELKIQEFKNSFVVDANAFAPPTLEEVKGYCLERANVIDPEKFFDFYTANGWRLGRGRPMRDWKACVRVWEKKERKTEAEKSEPSFDITAFEKRMMESEGVI